MTTAGVIAAVAIAAAVIIFSLAVMRAVANGYKITAVSLSFTPPPKPPKPAEADAAAVPAAELRAAS